MFVSILWRSKFLSFIGKNTFSILAMHLSVLIFIKLILSNKNTFHFTELQLVFLPLVQIIPLVLPILVINKYFPLLNGKLKTS